MVALLREGLVMPGELVESPLHAAAPGKRWEKVLKISMLSSGTAGSFTAITNSSLEFF